MDYHKIYDTFISDRRLKESELIASGQYVERHHILPRSLGGADALDNIIVLTAGDHYFAHRLLYKTHPGREMATAWWLISHTRRKDHAIKISRHQFEQMRIAFSQNMSGEGNPCADTEVYLFAHLDGREFIGTRHAFHEKYGVARNKIDNIFLKGAGRTRSADGWYLADEYSHDDIDGYLRKNGEFNARYNRTKHRFQNIESGDIVEATQGEMWKTYGGVSSGWSALLKNGRCLISYKGWVLEGNEVPDLGCRGEIFTLYRDSERHTGIQAELARKTNLSVTTVANIVSGKSMAQGWRCENVEPNIKYKPRRSLEQIAADQLMAQRQRLEAKEQVEAKLTEKVLVSARQHIHMKDWIAADSKRYDKARNRPALMELCKAHMKPLKRQHNKIDVLAFASQFESMNKFKQVDRSMYECARVNEWLDDIRQGMNDCSRKQVINLDTGQVFESVEAAARWAGLKNQTPIGMVCKGKRPRSAGYRWAYHQIDSVCKQSRTKQKDSEATSCCLNFPKIAKK